MEQVVSFFVMMLVSIFIENSIFSRAVGAGRVLTNSRKSMKTAVFSLLLVMMTFLSSIACYFVSNILKSSDFDEILGPLAYILTIGVIYLMVILIMPKINEKMYNAIADVLPYATFNCALFGTVVVSSYRNFSFAESVGYGLGSGFGYILASFLIVEGQKALASINIPKSFKGLPIIILYIGIVSLAFYGLIGHVSIF